MTIKLKFYEQIIGGEIVKYQIGDIIEGIFENIVGTGEIVKIKESLFFGITYIIKTQVTHKHLLLGEYEKTELLKIKEKDIIKKINKI
jgi:predicted polyphosphate/ATP-dependent NAD kinase